MAVFERTAPRLVLERCREADIVLTNKVAFDAAKIRGLPRLVYLGVTATGYDHVCLEAARARGIVITNVPVYGTSSVAQYVFALLLELCHHVGLHAGAVHAGEWSRSAAALCAGQIAGAAVDVASREPIAADNPLLRAPNCIITPHMAWASLESRRRLKQASIENLRAFLAGRPRNRVA